MIYRVLPHRVALSECLRVGNAGFQRTIATKDTVGVLSLLSIKQHGTILKYTHFSLPACRSLLYPQLNESVCPTTPKASPRGSLISH